MWFQKILVLIAVILAGCTKSQFSEDHQMVYRGSLPDPIKTLDPAVAYDAVSWKVVPLIYETLFQYHYLAEPFRVVPLLAADMPILSKDRKTVTIRIRPDVRFQDDEAFVDSKGKGRLVTAKDWIYSWKRLALPSLQSGGLWIFENRIVGFDAFRNKLVKAKKSDIPKLMAETIPGLKAIDPHTIRIKLLKPYPQLTMALAIPLTSVVPHEAIDHHADKSGGLHHHPVGTGPFKLKKWDRAHRVILERNRNYHPDFYPTEGHQKYKKLGLLKDAGKTLPFLDVVVFDIIREQQPTWLNFIKGNLDQLMLGKDSFEAALTDQMELSPALTERGVSVQIEAEPTSFFITFNMKDSLVGKNKLLRQAISSAIDRGRFLKIFTNSKGIKQTVVLPPGIAGRKEGTPIKYDFNAKRAKALLKKAGYPEGKGLPPLRFDLRSANSLARQLGEFFAKQLSEIGIRLNVVYNTFPAYLEKVKQGNFQISYGGWALDYPDAENAFTVLYGPHGAPGPNEANFDHPRFNQLFERLIVMQHGRPRSHVIGQMEAIVQEEVPWAYLYFRTRHHLAHPWLKNFRAADVIQNSVKYLKIDRELKKRTLAQVKKDTH